MVAPAPAGLAPQENTALRSAAACESVVSAVVGDDLVGALTTSEDAAAALRAALAADPGLLRLLAGVSTRPEATDPGGDVPAVRASHGVRAALPKPQAAEAACALIPSDGSFHIQKEEEMRHPSQVWTDPAFAEEPLRRLLDEYKRPISTGPNKLSPATVRKYLQDLEDFLRALVKHGIAPVLGSVTPDAVSVWTADQEARGNAPDSIAVRVISLKTFTNKYVHKTLELTTVDLLRKVARPTPKPKPRQGLTDEELERLIALYDRDTFEDVRDRAILVTLAATGLRRSAVRTLGASSYDRISGGFQVWEKGDVERLARLSPKANKAVREYVARRPRHATTEQLWVTAEGEPLSDGGFGMILRRAKRRSGMGRLHAHLFRHSIAQRAARAGAKAGEIQTLLGHRTQVMARRYAGEALNAQGAELMVQYSPIG